MKKYIRMHWRDIWDPRWLAVWGLSESWITKGSLTQSCLENPPPLACGHLPWDEGSPCHGLGRSLLPKAPFSFDTRSRDFPVACQQDQLGACVLCTGFWCLVSACTFPNIVLLFIFLPGQVTLYGRASSLQRISLLLTRLLFRSQSWIWVVNSFSVSVWCRD